MINHALQMMDCMVDVPAALVAFLVNGDWIMKHSNKTREGVIDVTCYSWKII